MQVNLNWMLGYYVVICNHDILECLTKTKLGAVKIVKEVSVTYRIHETIVILSSLKHYFMYP